jgi:hypothetical protein
VHVNQNHRHILIARLTETLTQTTKESHLNEICELDSHHSLKKKKTKESNNKIHPNLKSAKLENKIEKGIYHLVKALPFLARLSVSASTLLRAFGGLDFAPAMNQRKRKKGSRD